MKVLQRSPAGRIYNGMSDLQDLLTLLDLLVRQRWDDIEVSVDGLALDSVGSSGEVCCGCEPFLRLVNSMCLDWIAQLAPPEC